MANFNEPTNETPGVGVWAFVRANIISAVTWFETRTGLLNIPTGAKSFSAGNRRFERYDGSGFETLLPNEAGQALGEGYNIRVDNADYAESAGTTEACTGKVDEATTADNALSLGGHLASTYTQDADIRPVNRGGTGTTTVGGIWNAIQTSALTVLNTLFFRIVNNLSELNTVAKKLAARTNLDVYSKGEIDTKVAVLYSLTSETIGTSNQNVTAPAGYAFMSLQTTLSLVINSINTAGTVVNLRAITGGNVNFFWIKRG